MTESTGEMGLFAVPITIYVRARDREHAVKIASEHRIQIDAGSKLRGEKRTPGIQPSKPWPRT